MQVGALFAYPSVQCTGRFFAVVRTLLPVRIAELLFCVLKCARSSFRRALRNAKRGEDLGRGEAGDGWEEGD